MLTATVGLGKPAGGQNQKCLARLQGLVVPGLGCGAGWGTEGTK